jgi:hypothetical protein
VLKAAFVSIQAIGGGKMNAVLVRREPPGEPVG